MSRELLGEGRQRATVLQPVLKTVPRTGHEAIDDATFADWTALVGAQISDRADPCAITEYRDTLSAAACDNAGTLVRDGKRGTDVKPTVIAGGERPSRVRAGLTECAVLSQYRMPRPA